MLEKTVAPWTPETVEALNAYQRSGRFHPFTCGNDRADEAHQAYAEKHGDRDWGVLVAQEDGWRCLACGYRQDWAHAFMAVPRPEGEGMDFPGLSDIDRS